MNDYVIRQQTRRAMAFSQVGLGTIAADAVWNAHQIATERRAGMRHEFDWPDYCLVPINDWRGWLESSAPEKDCARICEMARHAAGAMAWVQRKAVLVLRETTATACQKPGGERARVDPKVLLGMPEYGVFVPSLGRFSPGPWRCHGLIGFVDERLHAGGNLGPELHLLALVDLGPGLPEFTTLYSPVSDALTFRDGQYEMLNRARLSGANLFGYCNEPPPAAREVMDANARLCAFFQRAVAAALGGGWTGQDRRTLRPSRNGLVTLDHCIERVFA